MSAHPGKDSLQAHAGWAATRHLHYHSLIIIEAHRHAACASPSGESIMKAPILVAMTVLATLLSGCGKDEQTYKTADGQVTVKQDGKAVTFEATGPDGARITAAAGDEGVAIPAGFPKDVPILDGAKPTAAMTQGAQMMVHLQVPVGLADAAKFYNDALKGQGWDIESTMTMNEMAMLTARKDTRECSVAVLKEGDAVLVQLVVSPQE
ncbi:MAG: hypothetical protein RBS10_08710 [Thauera propionica]|nr:hypothetical protein [Thauera propionica]